MSLSRFIANACALSFSCILLLAGCSFDDGPGYERAGDDPGESASMPSAATVIAQRELRVRNGVHSGLFTPASAYIVVLDSSLSPVDTLVANSTDITKKTTIQFPAYDYPSPYVKVVLEGWFHLWSVPSSINGRFEVISDITEDFELRVDLMTHLDASLVKKFVKDGESFSGAKRKAMRVVSDEFGFTYHESYPAERYERTYNEIAGLYAYLMRDKTDDSFATNLEYLCTDLQDEKFNNSLSKMDFATFILGNWLSVDSILNVLDNSGDVRKWRFFEKVIEEGFGLPECSDRLGKLDAPDAIDAMMADYDLGKLVCDANKDLDSLVYFRRVLTELEKTFDPCVANDSTRGKPVLVMGKDSVYYKCMNEYSTYGMSKDSTHLEFKNTWEKADTDFIRNYRFGVCDSVGKKGLYRDSVYVCEYSEWSVNKYYWRFWNNDTLSYYMGECDTTTLWNMGVMPDSSEYVCTHNYLNLKWNPVNDVSRFLSQQPKCNRDTDLLRSFSYGDLLHYVCADVKIGTLPVVYTFKDTTHRVADSLAFIASQEPCKISDTLKYVYDSTSNRFYHCEIRNNVLKYYEVEESVGRKALCGEFVKTLPSCTAQSDTTEIFKCPYNAQYESSLNMFYHCSNDNGKYGYAAVDNWGLRLYKSLQEAKTSDFCDVVGDTLQYKQDDYDYYYYCAKKDGGEYYLKNVDLSTLREMLADDYLQRALPCDAATERWRKEEKRFLEWSVYYVCDYDTNSEFTFMRVSEVYYSNYAKRESAGKSAVKLNACSAEQIAARGTPVEVEDGYITDPRNGRRYRTVTIGKQTWMAESLNYFDTLATPNLIGSANCSSNEEECNKTGGVYRWNAVVDLPKTFDSLAVYENLCLPVQGICPVGWHVPTVEEWAQLFQYVSYQGKNLDYGAGLKSEGNWTSFTLTDGDLFGFSAAPVSWNTNTKAYFASSDILANSSVRYGYGVQFNDYEKTPTIFYEGLSRTYSVRCVKD